MQAVQCQYSIECIKRIGFASIITVLSPIKTQTQRSKFCQLNGFFFRLAPTKTTTTYECAHARLICCFFNHLINWTLPLEIHRRTQVYCSYDSLNKFSLCYLNSSCPIMFDINLQEFCNWFFFFFSKLAIQLFVHSICQVSDGIVLILVEDLRIINRWHVLKRRGMDQNQTVFVRLEKSHLKAILILILDWERWCFPSMDHSSLPLEKVYTNPHRKCNHWLSRLAVMPFNPLHDLQLTCIQTCFDCHRQPNETLSSVQ